MIVRLTHNDIASSEYSSNAPFHNVTILLPIVISVLVLIAVLCTLFAFMRKQEILHEPRECSANATSASAQNMRHRSASIRSKEDMNDMLSFPMTDYHSLCGGNTNSKSKLCEVGMSTPNVNAQIGQHLVNEPIYGKAMINTGTLAYASPKRTMFVDNGEMHQHLQRPSTRVTVNSHHIYAEPNPSIQSYGQQQQQQQRCMVSNIATSGETCLLDTADGANLASTDTFRALLVSNAHI